ncbi:hypothetical protein BABINDRAFT_10567 [Babjeviella inositovora NRRL Y-12698]|uniref:BZIP domain-containing protein n=1 Tax=Babjeviella inositovora NRRL Y-12698 TaxID=984486 RepID=A0A1E3QIL2_9ASCO|nr:uncharacterized protein BABINDRAFT_10567 [Babjeviella inositovora NRRL Y-12698]ODQ76922.1 hypothetical protein BABINDRAFT_10567 [Babjeviella inositovora NRRL Y-12698]
MNHKMFDLEPNPFEQSFASKEKPDGPQAKPLTALLTSSPSLLTPGGSRKLPPLVLSPNLQLHPNVPAGGANPWRNFKTDFSPTGLTQPKNGPSSYFSAMNGTRSGLTPNESNLRTGLTPGDMGVQLPGISHPPLIASASGLMTPGLQSLLGSLPSFTPGGNATNATAGMGMMGAEMKPEIPVEVKQEGEKRKREGSEETEKERKTSDVEKKRKKKKVKSPEEAIDYDDDEATKGFTEEEKRRHFLERNRLAASKCRARKKEHITKMTQELKFYATECSNLTHQLNMVREQVLNLRSVLFNHKHCPALADSVGGVDGLNALLQATNYAAQLVSNNPIGTNLVANGVQPPPPSGIVEASVPTAVNGGIIPSNIAPLGGLGDAGEVKPTINSMMPPMMNVDMPQQLMGMNEVGSDMIGIQMMQR